MNESWKIVRLGDEFDLQMGKTPDRKNSSYWNNGENLWVSIADISNSSKYIDFTKETISNQAAEKIKKIPKGIVIMSFKLSVGKVCITNTDLYTNEAIMAFLPRKEYYAEFLYYRLLSFEWTQGLNKAVKGITLNKSSISNTKMYFPSLDIQHEIVTTLNKASELIALRKKQLEELDALAESVFYDMFGDPVKNEKGWKKGKLGDLCIKITDGTHDTPQRLKYGIKFITGKHIEPYYIDYDNSDYVTEDVHKEIYKRCNPEYGDVLFTNIGVNMGTAAINIVDYEFSMKNVALLKLTNSMNGYFVEYALNAESTHSEIMRQNGAGGAQTFLSLKQIKEIIITTPPSHLQNQFAAIIEKIESQKTFVKKALQESEDLFQRLMQDLFKPH